MSSLIMPEAHFGLEVSYQWKLSASTRNLVKNLLCPGASDETIRQRGLTVGCNIDGSLQCALGDQEGEAAWETEKFSLLLTIPISFFSSIRASFIISCASPSFCKSRDDISFRGGCNTPYYGIFNYLP
jgi:hypothetical protein